MSIDTDMDSNSYSIHYFIAQSGSNTNKVKSNTNKSAVTATSTVAVPIELYTLQVTVSTITPNHSGYRRHIFNYLINVSTATNIANTSGGVSTNLDKYLLRCSTTKLPLIIESQRCSYGYLLLNNTNSSNSYLTLQHGQSYRLIYSIPNSTITVEFIPAAAAAATVAADAATTISIETIEPVQFTLDHINELPVNHNNNTTATSAVGRLSIKRKLPTNPSNNNSNQSNSTVSTVITSVDIPPGPCCACKESGQCLRNCICRNSQLSCNNPCSARWCSNTIEYNQILREIQYKAAIQIKKQPQNKD